MNLIFNKYFDKFVSVFIDDLLVYSKTEAKHKGHLKLVLQTLREHELYAKFRKCEFYKTKIKYLGHIISREGLIIDCAKVNSMVN